MKISKHTGAGITIVTNVTNAQPAYSFYKLSAMSIAGKEISFEQYAGKKVLLVNVASECGFTPQYKELEQLHQLYKDRLVVLGFPSNDFGKQEPGTDEAIADFCAVNFGVTFQLFSKGTVTGTSKQQVYEWLTSPSINGWNSVQPSWNFCKYLISENGTLLGFYSSSVSPLSDNIVKAIQG